MPLYEYECDACGHRFEKIQKFSDPLEDKCPKCGGPVHKLASSPAIQFKGSGWYVTDYAKKDGTKDSTAGTRDTKDTKADTTDTKDAKAATDTTKDAKAGSDTTKDTKPAKASNTKDT